MRLLQTWDFPKPITVASPGVGRLAGSCYRYSTMNDETPQAQLPGPCGPLDLSGAEPNRLDEELAALAKAIAHPARLQIIRLLSSRAACVCGEIVGELPLAQSTVSEHLRLLKEAGLVKGEVDGPRVCYCLDPATMARLKCLVDAL